MRQVSEDEKFMKEALKQAKKAYKLGEVPIGCVIVRDGAVIARGYNRRNTDKNTLSHAEISAIRKASKALGIQTLASQRFERGGDFDVIKRSVERATFLYDQIGWKNMVPSQFNQNVASVIRVQ